MPRKEFTDSQRAEIFVRDRATCCFSGANLWLLDSPLRPGYHRDWVDHIIPSARGGSSEIDNGVCASHIFNAKRRHNSADTTYLFCIGSPSVLYYELFGVPPVTVTDRLDKLRNLQPADWYFNRAIGLVLLAFDYRVGVELYDSVPPKRDDVYWLRAALRKISEFQTFETASIEGRSLIDSSSSVIQRHWLHLRHVRSECELLRTVAPLYDYYRKSAKLWFHYFYDASLSSERKAIMRKISHATIMLSDVRECVESHSSFTEYINHFPFA